MRTKFLLGAGILILLLFLCLGIGAGIRAVQTPVVEQVQQARLLAARQPEKAEHCLQEAQTAWHAHWRVLAAVSLHDTMDNVDRWFGTAMAYLDSGATDDFLSACVQLETFLESIIQDHRLSWWNLL